MSEEFNVTEDDEGAITVLVLGDEQKVGLRFTAEGEHGPVEIEVGLAPDLARELAFTLTRASYISEGDEDL